MVVDDLKLFLHGLPPDCQESTLKDFLKGTCTHRSGLSLSQGPLLVTPVTTEYA